jgi:hypothetical protein
VRGLAAATCAGKPATTAAFRQEPDSGGRQLLSGGRHERSRREECRLVTKRRLGRNTEAPEKRMKTSSGPPGMKLKLGELDSSALHRSDMKHETTEPTAERGRPMKTLKVLSPITAATPARMAGASVAPRN